MNLNKKYQYVKKDKYNNNIVITVNERYILLSYWPIWTNKMQDRTGDVYTLTYYNFKDCVNDFITINWACEI